MNKKRQSIRNRVIIYINLLFILLFIGAAYQFPALNPDKISSNQTTQEKKILSLQDIMQFKSLQSPIISDKGDWVVYHTLPDRGNGEAIAYHISPGNTYTIPRGAKPIITKDSRWVAVELLPDFLELEKAQGKDKPKPGMALLDTTSGNIMSVEKVKGFVFSEDSRWLVYRLFPEEEKEKPGKPGDKSEDADKPGEKKAEKKPDTTPLVLRELSSGKEIRLEKVGDSALDPASRYFAYSLYDPDSDTQNNGIYIRELQKNADAAKKIQGSPNAKFSNLTWSKTKSRLAFIFHENYKKEENENPGQPLPSLEKKENTTYVSTLMVWDGLKGTLRTAVSRNRLPRGWMLPNDNKLTWTKDENRLFVGLKPMDEYQWTLPQPPPKEEKDIDPYDIDRLLAKREVAVWHWNDPLLNSHQKKQWERFRKQIYLSVYHFQDDWFVPLTDKEVPELRISENPEYALGLSDYPYRKEITWNGIYKDIYLVNLKNGSRQPLLTHHQFHVFLSPQGQFVVYYRGKHWHLYNIRLHTTKNLTQSLPVPFYDEDHDLPGDVPGYGIAGWTGNDQAVLVYDKYDTWQFNTTTGEALCLTNQEGRKNKIAFRILKLDPEELFFKKDQEFLFSVFSHEEKFTGFYSGTAGKKGVKLLLQGPNWFNFLKKAKEADRILYTRERFEEFPDLWVSDTGFTSPQKVSEVNPQVKNFWWGKAELIEWQSLDNIRLQGVVIKPENYDPNKRYPVLVYFYEISSDRLYRFNQVTINHRPCFPYYTGNGYVIFLPDIKYEVGRPGLSAVKCLVPGVHKLISMGIADPKAIGLHGHSWGGYQTAFIITQTDLFAAAIAGAAVTNMTSAYNGIRWGSGLARQFQYEKSQSRIGPSFIDAPELYIQNSPVFFAERIRTPLLLEFGDKDDAVPWYQGIELYLAMRRLDKNCIFLQYLNEPHHLKKYPNKLDYTIKMKEFLDHYLKGEPAADWITKGVPFHR